MLPHYTIEISKLTDADIGRQVTFVHAGGTREFGTLHSWNNKQIFVRFGSAPRAKAAACDPQQLSWSHPNVPR